MTGRFLFRRWLLVGPPFLWMLVLFLLPLVLVLSISLSTTRVGMPPYEPLFTWEDNTVVARLNFENYLFILEESIYWRATFTSLRIAALATLVALALAYPLAYAISRCRGSWRAFLLFLVVVPFWTSLLIRVYSWMAILRNDGLLNTALMSLGVISQPLQIMNSEVAVYIGIVYSYLPFMLLPIYSSLAGTDQSLIEAARDLGCTERRAFWKITAPLSLPGVMAGSALVFIPAVGEFVIPDLLGGASTQMIGRTIWVEFFNNRDWPVASAVTVVLLVVLVVPIVMFQARLSRSEV